MSIMLFAVMIVVVVVIFAAVALKGLGQ